MARTVLPDGVRRVDQQLVVRGVPESVVPDVQSRDARGIAIGEH